MKKIFVQTTMIAFASLFALQAIAQPDLVTENVAPTLEQVKPVQAGMKHIDVNKDGRLSKDEVVGHEHLEKNFDRKDRNNNDFIGRGDKRRFMRDKVKQLDQDGNKKLDRSEVEGHEHLEKNFDRLDRNDNAFIGRGDRRLMKKNRNK
jgi:hypothetical protein